MTDTAESSSLLSRHVALVVVQVCFGFFPLVGKAALETFTPEAVATWRIGSGALCLGVLAALRYGRRMIPRRDLWPRLFVCSLLGIAINQVCFLEGIKRAPTMNAGLMIGLIPALTYLVALTFRVERWHSLRAFGILVGLAAVLQLHLGDVHVLGNVFLLLNTFSYAMYLVLSRPLLAVLPPLVVIAWVFILSLVTLPFLAQPEDLIPPTISPAAWAALAYILVFPTSLGYLLNIFAMERLPSSTVAVYVFIQPLIVIATGVFLRAEPFTSRTALAVAGVLLAMWLVVRPRLRRRSPMPPALPVPDAPPLR
jgi:drug/metabolite transporter (DMT)-like permease